MRRIILAICLLAAVGFGLNWGIYGGPGIAGTLTNMDQVHSALSEYNVASIPRYQIGIATPIVIRLWNFTLGGGNSYSWQTASGSDYKAAFRHDINLTEFGYIIDLSDHLRLRPVIGMGDYNIHLRISEIGTGFGSPDDGDGEGWSYDYNNFSLAAGVGLAYYWKFENRVVVGLEAKARYLVPLETDAAWEAQGTYDDVFVDGFYPHTPIVGINFFIGYEKVEEDRIEEGWEEE
ncbi:hypothetical protein CEE36_10225 [candidate division TA06 bacterium B3_TA06]|uniref:Uncharacterized protein n=1 Tax=candidate division TA06 bacterium B3_TA06 TaxID=2012487 RepID=A0A532UXK8_UNCT6|nr:MAG: hypothetical protein CEE36_10225 [candidate division TA06 bacterium B3_TA06]